MRISETIALKITDLKITSECIHVNVKKAKRRPNGFQAILANDNLVYDFLIKYLETYSLKEDNYCFPLSIHNRVLPLSQGKAQIDLKALLRHLKMDPTNYAFHSCKLGAASSAAERG